MTQGSAGMLFVVIRLEMLMLNKLLAVWGRTDEALPHPRRATPNHAQTLRFAVTTETAQ